MARKKLKLNRLKDKAWGYFSKFIRHSAADIHGIVKCVTCDSPHYWKDAHAGHYIHGHYKPTFLIRENVHVQCVRCNKYLNGNLNNYEAYMLHKYGQEKIDELRALSHKVEKPERSYYDEVILHYKKYCDENNL